MYEERRGNRQAVEKLERLPTVGKEAKGARAGKEAKGARAAAEGMENKVRFLGLAVLKIHHVPHSLDVMHITKNVCESLLGTLLNMPERTKDGPKARADLKSMGIRQELHANDDDDEVK